MFKTVINKKIFNVYKLYNWYRKLGVIELTVAHRQCAILSFENEFNKVGAYFVNRAKSKRNFKWITGAIHT